MPSSENGSSTSSTAWSLCGFHDKKPSRIIIGFFAVFLLIAVPIFSLLDTLHADQRFQVENYQTSKTSPFEAIGSRFSGLSIISNVTSVDVPNQLFKATMAITPVGSYAIQSDDSGVFKRPNISFSLIVGSEIISFKFAQPISSQSFSLAFQSGNVNKYPFDSFLTTFTVAAFPDATALQSTSIPIAFAIIGAAQGFLIDEQLSADAVHPASIYSISLKATRSITVQFFSLFIVVSMWIVSAAVFILASTLWLRDRRVEPPTIAVCASFLFALPAIRNSQPGVPPIGATVDLAGFFWNLALVLISTVVLITNYVKKYQRDGFPNGCSLSEKTV
jgi:hypothetical protein